MNNKPSDSIENIRLAGQYFAKPIMPPFPYTLATNPLKAQQIKDSEGLVQFIIASPKLLEKPEIEKMKKIKDIQIALISIMANHLAFLKKTDNDAYYSPNHWLETLNHLPLLGPNKIETKTLDKHTFDFSIAQAFVQLLLGSAINIASPSLAEFIEFLRKQGKNIEIGLRNSIDSYKTITIAGVTEIFHHNNHYIFIPKLKLLSVRFSYESAKLLLASCVGREFNLSLEYSTVTSLFDMSSLEDPVVNKQFYDFIKKHRRMSISQSETFFNGDFYLQ